MLWVAYFSSSNSSELETKLKDFSYYGFHSRKGATQEPLTFSQIEISKSKFVYASRHLDLDFQFIEKSTLTFDK